MYTYRFKPRLTDEQREYLDRVLGCCRLVYNRRTDVINYITTELVGDPDYTMFCAEDLSVSGMMKNHRLAGAIGGSSWHEFRTKLEYKALWSGKRVEVIDRYYPSTKTCSSCGYVNKDITLAIREWDCPQCGCHHDRNVNAAVNIGREGYRLACVAGRGGYPSVRGEMGGSRKTDANTDASGHQGPIAM